MPTIDEIRRMTHVQNDAHLVPSKADIDAVPELTTDEKKSAKRLGITEPSMLKAKQQIALRAKGKGVWERSVIDYTLRLYATFAAMRKDAGARGGVIALSGHRSATLGEQLPISAAEIVLGCRSGIDPAALIKTRLDLDARAAERRAELSSP